jgi:hypothetical protein
MSALDGLLEEMKADPKIAAVVASDPVMAAHLANVERLFGNLQNNDGYAVELPDEAVKIISQQPGTVRERISALAHYLLLIPDRTLIAAGLVPPPAKARVQ